MKGKTGVYIDSAVMPLLTICCDQQLADVFKTLLNSTDPGFDIDDYDYTSPYISSIVKLLEDGGFVKYDFGDLVIPDCKERLRIKKNEQK